MQRAHSRTVESFAIHTLIAGAPLCPPPFSFFLLPEAAPTPRLPYLALTPSKGGSAGIPTDHCLTYRLHPKFYADNLEPANRQVQTS